MVTKFDIFAELYEKGGPCKIIEIVKILNQNKKKYDKIRKTLDTLAKMKLVVKTAHGYERKMTAESRQLFHMLRYCIKNGVNYNDLLDETVAKYLSKAFLKKTFTVKDIGLHPRTFSKISRMLEKNGFLIVLSRKPFRAVVPYNSFLGELVVYYGYRALAVRKDKNEYFKEIKKELAKFNGLKEKNTRKYQSILGEVQIKFIHHSLSIEGNPITLAQTIKLLEHKIVPENLSLESIQEVQNYQEAFLQMLQNVRDDQPLTKATLLNYHFISLQHKLNWAGRIRDRPVFIRGNEDFKVAKPEEIDSLLDKLVAKYNDFLKNKRPSLKEVLKFSAYIHNEFQHIHPFFDGNSRTTRLITFHFLQMNGIPVFDIPLGMLEKYVLSTKGAKKRSDEELTQALQEIILYNLKTINEKIS
ncbi:MAG: Fic family protein [Nanoarchaeota archaeon]